jgi:hypothetical protein
MKLASENLDEYREARRRRVMNQIAGRGIRDCAILDAFLAVPRESFVSPRLAEFAYEDTPLPIEAEQTISQPYIVAVMIPTSLPVLSTTGRRRNAPDRMRGVPPWNRYAGG